MRITGFPACNTTKRRSHQNLECQPLEFKGIRYGGLPSPPRDGAVLSRVEVLLISIYCQDSHRGVDANRIGARTPSRGRDRVWLGVLGRELGRAVENTYNMLEGLGIVVEPGRADLAYNILLSSLKRILESTGRRSLFELASRIPHEYSPLRVLARLDPRQLEILEANLERVEPMPIEDMQVLVQKTLPSGERKKLASYYTVDLGIEYMARLTQLYTLYSRKRGIVLGDPFLGSARTLTAATKRVPRDKISLVYGVEPHLLAALVAYASLLETVGDKEKVRVYWGDAFQLLAKGREGLAAYIGLDEKRIDPRVFETNVVLTNPPFTRWSNLPSDYRKKILSTIAKLGYAPYIERGDPGLQILSLMLIDSILARNSLLATVLPAATFYTLSGRGLKRLLREKYSILALLENTESSFSQDSGFKEFILAAIKNPSNKAETLIARLSWNNLDQIARATIGGHDTIEANETPLARVDLRSLPEILDRNWLSLFEDPQLVELVSHTIERGYETGVLDAYRRVFGRDSIVRGVEMYGVDFFFIPNKHWIIEAEERDYITIRRVGTRQILQIERRYLEPILRKPQNYSNRILVEPETYALAIPPEEDPESLDSDLKRYIRWGEESGTAANAINAWKRGWRKRIPQWYMHIGYQIRVKRPFGRVFLPDKIDLRFKNRGVYANYTSKPTLATKNFYIIRIDDPLVSKALALWYNSIVFLALFFLIGKKISNTYTRLLEDDHLEIPTLNPSKTDLEPLLSHFNSIAHRDLVSLQEQLRTPPPPRRRLDDAIARLLGIKKHTLQQLYRTLLARLKASSLEQCPRAAAQASLSPPW